MTTLLVSILLSCREMFIKDTDIAAFEFHLNLSPDVMKMLKIHF